MPRRSRRPAGVRFQVPTGRTCLWPGCDVIVRGTRLFDPPHWRLLPLRTRDRLLAAMEEGPDSRAYEEARAGADAEARAIDAVMQERQAG